jgi:cobalt-zinc-cadmium efflux system outer membrane protein
VTITKNTILTLLISLFVSGIAGTVNGSQNRPEKTRLRTELPSATINLTPNDNPAITTPAPVNELTLYEALLLTLSQNPELKTFSWQIEARRGEIQQAQVLPNPELGIEVENILGEDDRRGFKAAETTLELSQLVELGGKRQQRIQIASLKQELADWDLDEARLAAIATASQAFFNCLTAQARVQLARENLQLSEKVFKTVQLRVQAGKASPITENRARMTVRQNQIALKKEQHKLTAAQRRLAAGWWADQPHFNKTTGRLETINKPPSWPLLLKLIEQNPEIARQKTELELQESQLNLAEAYGVPDMTLGGGIKRHEESDDYTFLVGVSFSLPVFDRNSGAIRSAQAETSISQKKGISTLTRLKTKLRENYELLLAAYEEADSLQNLILPTAEANFSAADYGYRQGQFKFIEVLIAQKTLFEIREQLIQSLSEFHTHRLNIEQLTGQKLTAGTETAAADPTLTTEEK